MYPIAPVIRATTIALWPVVKLMKAAMAGVDFLFGGPEPQEIGQISQPRLMHFLEESREEGVLSAHDDWMARNIMKLEKTRLRDVMVPMERVVSVPRNATVDDLRNISKTRVYSRIPVYDGDKGNIVGLVGLVEYLCDCSGKPVAEFIRRAPRLKESMSVNEALLTLRRTRDHMGLVVDNNDKVIGIATIKDLVEEIVGELEEW
jgi:CBS domain containing-hemolysin-like protein